MNTDHKLIEAVLPRLTPGMTQAQRLAQIDAALRRMQQTLAYMFAHLTAENIKYGVTVGEGEGAVTGTCQGFFD